METQNTYVIEDHRPLERWAIISLFGRTQIAGRFEFENSLLRVDIPTSEGFRTKYVGINSIFEMDIVSETIARAAVPVEIAARALDVPIVSRQQYEEMVKKQTGQIRDLERTIHILQNRLMAIDALPEHTLEAEGDLEDDTPW